MKQTLKKWLETLATKRKELRESKKAKTEAKTKALAGEIEQIEDGLEAAEKLGAVKETDEIEIKIVEEPETVDLKELVATLTPIMENSLKEALRGHQKDQVTKESIKEAIEAALAKRDKPVITKEDITAVAKVAIEEQVKALTKAKKMVHDVEDADLDSDDADDTKAGDAAYYKRMNIEMPISWCKGNLPLHGKQLLNLMMRRDTNLGISESDLRRGKAMGDAILARYKSYAIAGTKALTSTGSGTGDEFVPTDLSSELNRRFFLASNLASLILGREIDMPTNPYELPLGTTRPTFYKESTENTDATPSTPGTSKTTLTAVPIKGEVDFSYEVDEDSIVPILPFVQTMLAEAAADTYESILINGDTTATHQDSDTELVAKAAERSWKGFRKLALAVAGLKSDISSGGLNEANLRALRKIMGKYGISTSDCVWLVGPKGYSDLQAITNVATLDKFGPKATILTGEIAALFGIPIIVSERVREDLNASGVFDNTTTTKGSVNLVNLSQFWAGRRRDFTVEVDKLIRSSQHIIVATFRRAFQPQETPSATIASTVIGFNYTS